MRKFHKSFTCLGLASAAALLSFPGMTKAIDVTFAGGGVFLNGSSQFQPQSGEPELDVSSGTIDAPIGLSFLTGTGSTSTGPVDDADLVRGDAEFTVQAVQSLLDEVVLSFDVQATVEMDPLPAGASAFSNFALNSDFTGSNPLRVQINGTEPLTFTETLTVTGASASFDFLAYDGPGGGAIVGNTLTPGIYELALDVSVFTGSSSAPDTATVNYELHITGANIPEPVALSLLLPVALMLRRR